MDDEAHGKNTTQGEKGKENQERGTLAPEDGNVRVMPEFKKPRSIFAGIGKGSDLMRVCEQLL
jgi:hypothetical protein